MQSFILDLGKTTALAGLMAVPLLTTLIVNLYRQTRALPATKARLYSLFVDLLSGGWDAAKQTHRGGRFGPEDKMTVLVRLAALMHLNRRADAGEDTFRAAIRATLASFDSRWKELLDEILQDGLIVRSGLVLMFAQSFQEFLAARDMQSDPTGRKPTQALRQFLKGDDWWREVVAFYIGNSGAPQEMFHWVRSIGRESGHKNTRGDFEARVEALQKALEDSFPGFTPARTRPGGSAEGQVVRDSDR